MKNRTTVTYEEFCTAVQALKAEGEKTSLAIVRTHLGKGSFSTLLKMMDKHIHQSLVRE